MERWIKIPGILCILLFITLIQSVSFGQSVDVRLQVFQQNVGNFYIGDLDFLQANSQKQIFEVFVENVTGEPYGRFDFEIHYVPTGQSSVEGGQLVHFWTNNVHINGNGRFTNSDLSESFSPPWIRTGEQLVVIDTDLFPDKVDPIKNYVRRTGKLPSGRYEFYVRFLNSTHTDAFMVIYNPTIIHLSTPGTRLVGAGSELTGMGGISGTPLFQWHSDARLFNLNVFEKLPTDRTVNDVFGHEPFAEIMDISRQYFQYPLEPTTINEPGQTDDNGNPQPDMVSNGVVRPLQEGKTYFWFVEAKIPTVTPGQYDILKSEVFQFAVAALDGVQNEHQRILEALKNILIPGYKAQLDQFRGMNPTGNIYMNGRKVTVEELETLSFEVMQRNFKIKKVEVD